MKNLHSPNLVGIGSQGPEIWLHEYLISHWNQCKLSWVQTLWTRPFTLLSMGLITHLSGHISGPHEPIHVKFGAWGFFIMSYWNMVMEVLKYKNGKKNDDGHTSALYGTVLIGLHWRSGSRWTSILISMPIPIYQYQYQYTNTNTNTNIPIPIPIPILISILILESIKSDCKWSILVSSVLSAH